MDLERFISLGRRALAAVTCILIRSVSVRLLISRNAGRPDDSPSTRAVFDKTLVRRYLRDPKVRRFGVERSNRGTSVSLLSKRERIGRGPIDEGASNRCYRRNSVASFERGSAVYQDTGRKKKKGSKEHGNLDASLNVPSKINICLSSPSGVPPLLPFATLKTQASLG